MDRSTFATRLDHTLTNPLLRGLDIACVRMSPQDDGWWSPETRRTLEIYLYPGPFGADRLGYMDARARALVEQSAARLVGAHEAQLLPAPPVPLKAGEWLIECGYSTMLLSPIPFMDSRPLECSICLLAGAMLVLTGRTMHALLWRTLSTLRTPRKLQSVLTASTPGP